MDSQMSENQYGIEECAPDLALDRPRFLYCFPGVFNVYAWATHLAEPVYSFIKWGWYLIASSLYGPEIVNVIHYVCYIMIIDF